MSRSSGDEDARGASSPRDKRHKRFGADRRQLGGTTNCFAFVVPKRTDGAIIQEPWAGKPLFAGLQAVRF
jgi:hypothetical protein